MTEVAAVIVAAGRGTRASDGRAELPKQFRQIGGEIMLTRTLSMFLEHNMVGPVQPVIHAADLDLYEAVVARMATGDLMVPVFGGATRQASVRAGLEALAPPKTGTMRSPVAMRAATA